MLKRNLFSRLKRKSLKRTPLKRKKKTVDQEKIDKMKEFFLSVWSKRTHYCNVCGKGLGNEPHTYNFHHIVAKQRQKNYSIDITYDEKNIFIVCLDCHSVIESGIGPLSLTLVKDKLLREYEKYRC